MKNKSIITIVIAIVIVFGFLGLYLYSQNTDNQNISNSNQDGVQGRIIFGIKDAAADMGNISSVLITVNKAEIHSNTQGWVTLTSQTKQYDLLELKQSGNIALLVDSNVNIGTYDQMRLLVSKVIVIENNVQKEAKLPSGDLKVIGQVTVNQNATATAVFDFIADESLHVTGNGQFIFTPVIQLETRSDSEAMVKSNNEVDIQGGNVQTNTKLGMDINGEIKTNFIVDENVKLELIGNVISVKMQTESDSSIKVTSSQAVSTVVNGGYLDTAISVELVNKNGKKLWQVSGLKGLVLTNVYVDAVTNVVVNI